MNRNDLRRVDLNLLIVFETLMHERSVTRAAEKLFLGQPAISAALSRLRTLFDDPLFVRTGRSMEPTARAQEIFAHLSPALDSISTAMSRASEFDPATSTAVFRIGLSDDVEFGLLPPLLRRLRAEAPGIVLVVRRANYLLMPNLLASGEISVGVSYTDELPANAKRKTVRRSKPKILRADSAPGQLIEAGADVNRQNSRLDSPYLLAGAEGRLEILRLTLLHGADLKSTNRYGGTALIPACERGHVEVVKTLLQAGVDPNHVNKLGWTGLLEAILLSDGGPRHQEIVRLLIDAGADVNLADADGVSPLAHARQRGQGGIERLLLAAGAQ